MTEITLERARETWKHFDQLATRGLLFDYELRAYWHDRMNELEAAAKEAEVPTPVKRVVIETARRVAVLEAELKTTNAAIKRLDCERREGYIREDGLWADIKEIRGRYVEQAVDMQAANAKIAELERGIEKVREWCAAHKHYFEISSKFQPAPDVWVYKTKVPTTAHQL